MATFASTSAVLVAMAARISALTPSQQETGQAAEDDIFRVAIDLYRTHSGSRAVILTANAGVRKLPSRNCNTWQTNVTMQVYYTDVATADDQPTVYQRALIDAEDILADLYIWSADTDGINAISPQEAQVNDAGEGEIVVNRFLSIEFQRT